MSREKLIVQKKKVVGNLTSKKGAKPRKELSKRNITVQ
jgi:hypothetical protein